MDKLSKIELTKLFNRTFNKLIKFIRTFLDTNSNDGKEFNKTLELIEDTIKINYTLVISKFYIYVYKDHKDKIINKEESFLEINNFNKLVKEKSVISYIIPILNIYKEVNNKNKDKIHSFFIKFIKICDEYHLFM